MIGDWLPFAGVLLVAAATVFLPGLAALRGVGLRGLSLVALSPLMSVAMIAVLAIGFGAVGVAWTPVLVCLGLAVLVTIARGAGIVLGRLPGAPRPLSRRWMLPAAIAAGVIIGAWRLISYIEDPEGISQTNDAVFHLNAIRYIFDTSNASSLHVNSVIGGESFYPAAWHGVTSLVALTTGASIPASANILTVVIAALVWPLGITWLTAMIAGRTAAAFAAVLSTALQPFPLLMFQWGVLYPNALSTALIPAGVALVMSFPSWGGADHRWRNAIRAFLLLAVVVCAIALAQPAGLLPWAAISLVWVSARVLREGTGFVRRWRWIIVVLSWLVLGGVWLGLSLSTSGSHWPPFRGKFEVLLDVLFNGQLRIPFAWGVSVLMLTGIVVAARSARLRWFVLAWGGISVLYVCVAAIGAPVVRVGLLGAWYADPYRIASLAPIVVIPLAAIGLEAIVRFVAQRFRPGGPSEERWMLSVLALLAIGVFAMMLTRPVAMPAFIEGTFDRDSRYLMTEDSFLSIDERALLESLPDYVDEGARVIGNPSTGTGFGYMLSGTDVFPRTWFNPRTAEWDLLRGDLRNAAMMDEVCGALEMYGSPEYVLDFGLGESSSGRYPAPGMTGFEGQDGFELVAARGDASLWRITACGRR